MSQIVKEITKRVVKESTKKKPVTPASGSQSQQSFAKQLFEPSREDEFRILSSQELYEELTGESPDSAMQKLKSGVTQLSKLRQTPSEEIDPIEALRTQFREGQSTDKRRQLRTPTSGEAEKSKRRDRTDEPLVPSLPPDTGLDIPTGEPPGPDEPRIPAIGIEWPKRDIDKPASDDVYPTDDPDEEQPTEDKPRLEKDVYECESAKEIAQLFGLPEPVCQRFRGVSATIRGWAI